MTDTGNEFSLVLPVDQIRGDQSIELNANDTEREALAKRFGLSDIQVLSAQLTISADGDIIYARGELQAQATQSCIASGEPVAAVISEDITLDFIPENSASKSPDAETELAEAECDILFHDGQAIDFGEAVAQSLALALDPYPRSAAAADALKKAGVKSEEEARENSGPFAALAALKDGKD